MSDPLFVFLVSGQPEAKDDGFARAAWRRVVELVPLFYKDRKKPGSVIKADSVLRFIHFDCHAGNVGIYEHDFASKKDSVSDANAKSLSKDWTILDDKFKTAFGKLEKKQDPKEFVEWKAIKARKDAASDQAVSITDVYHSARNAPRGSLLELSIFSHAFVDGPVLFNTFADPALTTRDPDDTDGRAAIDFQANMGETGQANALEEFRKAFADTGVFRIWGCNIQDLVLTTPPDGGGARRCLILSTVRQVVREAFGRNRNKTIWLKAKTLPKGSTVVMLDMDRQMGHELELQKDRAAGHGLTPFSEDRLFEIRYHEQFDNHHYQGFFKDERDAKGRFARSLKRTLSDVVQFVAAETVDSYFFNAAKALQTVRVISGAPGTSSDFGPDGQLRIDPGGWEGAEFFCKFLGAQLADRHYVMMNGGITDGISDLASNGLP